MATVEALVGRKMGRVYSACPKVSWAGAYVLYCGHATAGWHRKRRQSDFPLSHRGVRRKRGAAESVGSGSSGACVGAVDQAGNGVRKLINGMFPVWWICLPDGRLESGGRTECQKNPV